MQAAQAMQQYAGWEPKEFAEQPQGPQASWQPQEFQEDQPNQQAQPDKSTQGQLNAASAQHQGQQQQSAQGSHQPGQHPGQAGQQQQQQDQQHMQQPDLQQAHWQTQGQEVGWGHEGHAQGDAQHADGGAEATRWQTGLQQPGYLSQQQNGSAEANAQQWHQPQLQSPDVQLNDSQPAGVQDAQTSQAGIAQSQQAAAGQDSNQSGFVYDSASGYWHDSASGYYYDANTGLYCHPQTQQWYSQDPATEEFTPYAAAQTISTAGANALGKTRL